MWKILGYLAAACVVYGLGHVAGKASAQNEEMQRLLDAKKYQ